MTRLAIALLPGRFAICRLDAAASVPPWAESKIFSSVTRTPDELSIVCDEAAVPHEVKAERNWRCFRVDGPIPFDTTGVAAAIASALTSGGISLLLIATWDTDYFLVRDDLANRAATLLRDAGHQIGEVGHVNPGASSFA